MTDIKNDTTTDTMTDNKPLTQWLTLNNWQWLTLSDTVTDTKQLTVTDTKWHSDWH